MKRVWLLVFLLIPAVTTASTVVALTLPELSQRADVIAFGSILSTETQMDASGRIFTTAEFKVQRAIKSAKAGEILILRVPGGRLPNGLTAHTSGAPRLETDQKWFGFFYRAPNQIYLPLGLSLGLLPAVQDSRGKYRVSRNLAGLSLMTGSGRRADDQSYQINKLPLEDLIEQVRTSLARNPGKE